MLGSKKTVAGLQATFNTIISDLAGIEERETLAADKAQVELSRALAEREAAVAFRFGLGKLLAGE